MKFFRFLGKDGLMVFQLRVLLLIASITIICYFDRSAISFAILPIEDELGLDDAQFGLILGAFGMGSVVVAFLCGFLLDRYGSIRTWAIGAAVWSLCTLSFSLANSFWSMLLLRIVLGMAEALHFPALLKTIADWLNPSFRARAIAIGLLGVPLASLIGAPFLTLLISSLGWRAMFVILGCFGLVWALVFPLFFRHRINPYHALSSNKIDPIAFSKMIRHKTFLAGCIAFFTLGYLVYFALFWLPGYFEKQLHIPLKESGALLMIPWAAGSLLLIAGGSLSDWLYNRTRSLRIARSYPIVGGLLLAGLFFSLLATATSVPAIIALLSLGLGFGFLVNSAIYALNADLFPHRVASAQGIMTGLFSLAGIIAPTITGFLVQWSGSFHSAFVLIGVVSTGGALSVYALQRKMH